jgi:hypothetical protein
VLGAGLVFLAYPALYFIKSISYEGKSARTTPDQEVQSFFVSAKASLTPSKDVIGLYPFALRPVLLGASDIPSKYIASSSCDSCAEASLCSV